MTRGEQLAALLGFGFGAISMAAVCVLAFIYGVLR